MPNKIIERTLKFPASRAKKEFLVEKTVHKSNSAVIVFRKVYLSSNLLVVFLAKFC